MGFHVFNTGALLGNAEWFQVLGPVITEPITIKAAYIWIGADGDADDNPETKGFMGDIHAEVRRLSDQCPIHVIQWDRYQMPISPSSYYIRTPDIRIEVGDRLQLWHFGNDFFREPVSKYHVRADVFWYTDGEQYI